MKIRLRLFGTLRRYSPAGNANMSCVIDVTENSDVSKVLRDLNIPPEEVMTVMVNNVQRTTSEILQEGDRIAVFSPVAGG